MRLLATSSGRVCTKPSRDCSRIKWVGGVAATNSGPICAVNRPIPLPWTNAAATAIAGVAEKASAAIPIAMTSGAIPVTRPARRKLPRRATTTVTSSAPAVDDPEMNPAVAGPHPWNRASNGMQSDNTGSTKAATSPTATRMLRNIGSDQAVRRPSRADASTDTAGPVGGGVE